MHSYDTNVSAFLVKLWKLVEDTKCDDLISWSECGGSFIITDQVTFARELLPRYFKHSNMASFIRQLNMYGFRKVTNFDKGGLRDDGDQIQFCNPFFLKGEEKLLSNIKRKIASSKGAVADRSSYSRSTNPEDILTDLTSILEKQETMNNMLASMKKENELLWRELTTLRKKHKTQEQIIQKVMQFLVSIVQSGKQNISMKRPVARMLENYMSQENSKSHVSRQLDVLGQASDIFFTVPPEKMQSPLGPVIQEVNDLDHDEAMSFNDGISDHRYNRPHRFAQTRSPGETSLGSPATDNGSAPDSDGEQILGLPADFITADHEFVPNIASVVNVSEDGIAELVPGSSCALESDVLIPNAIAMPEGPSSMSQRSNVISIPEDPSAEAIANNVSKLISVPDGTDVMSLLNSSPKNSSALGDIDSALEPVNLSFDLVPFNQILPSLSTFEKSEDSTLNDLSENYEFLSTPKVEKEFSLCGNSMSDSRMKRNHSEENILKSNENNLQVSLPDMTSLPSEEAKTTFSNHIKSTEENLDWLQSQLTSEILNVDPSFLLSLFSSDADVNNMSLESKLCQDNALKNPDSSIMGNELVQFNPMLDFGDVGLLDCLDPTLDDQTNNLSNKTQNLKRESLDNSADLTRTFNHSSVKKKKKTVCKPKRNSK